MNENKKELYDPIRHGNITAIKIYNGPESPRPLARLVFASNRNDEIIDWTDVNQRAEYQSGINGYTLIYDERDNKPVFESLTKPKKSIYAKSIDRRMSKFSKREMATELEAFEVSDGEVRSLIREFRRLFINSKKRITNCIISDLDVVDETLVSSELNKIEEALKETAYKIESPLRIPNTIKYIEENI